MRDTLHRQKASELLSRAISHGECLNCHLAPNAKGYSPVGIGGRQGRKYRAHRVIWEAAHGPIPDNLMVLHSCDNRRCINIDHLFLGTAKDNTQDMMNKGRNKFITHAKISTREQIEKIKELRTAGLTLNQIGQQFAVSIETIRVYLNKYRQAELV